MKKTKKDIKQGTVDAALAVGKDEMTIVKEKVKGMKDMVDSSFVTNDDELKSVADKIKAIRTLMTFVKQKKEKTTEPAKAIIAEARETYDPIIKECENAEIILKQRATKYMVEKEQKRIADENKIAAKVESGYMKPETAAIKLETMPEVQNTVRTNQGSGLRMAKRRVAKIIDSNLIPDEYWIMDEVRIRREAIEKDKNNLPQIPGVAVSDETSLSSI